MNRLKTIWQTFIRGLAALSPTCKEATRLQSEALDRQLAVEFLETIIGRRIQSLDGLENGQRDQGVYQSQSGRRQGRRSFATGSRVRQTPRYGEPAPQIPRFARDDSGRAGAEQERK